MNCSEFAKVLPDLLEHSHNIEAESHLRSCADCSSLLADLNTIAEQARSLEASDEPSPRVWNSLEIALRQEGLIREPKHEPALAGRLSGRWSLAWLVPVAAALVVGGVFYEQRPVHTRDVASKNSPATVQVASLGDDEQLLDALGARSPAIRAEYAANLANVNSYIHDAQQSADADPNDEEAQQLLMDAYGEKAMIYQLALDRSLQ